jgi:hypothetical protein
MKPKIWVKSYPRPREIVALGDLNSDGIELFLDEDTRKSEECLRIATGSYPHVAVELFEYYNIRGRPIAYDIFAEEESTRERSRDYLNSLIWLAHKYNATHLQLHLSDGYRFKPGNDLERGRRETLARFKDYFRNLHSPIQIFFENVIVLASHSEDVRINSTGHCLSDFDDDLPLEYDLSHHALALELYSRADEFGLGLSEEEQRLARSVKEKGITAALLEEIRKRKFYFVHFDNASSFRLNTRSDTSPQDQRDAILDLDTVLPELISRSSNITPEVDDEDYIERPNLKEWIRRLQRL